MLDGLDEVKRRIVDLESNHVSLISTCIGKSSSQLLKKAGYLKGNFTHLNCRGNLLAGHARAERFLDTILGTLGVCLSEGIRRVLPSGITVDQAERVHHLEEMFAMGLLQRRVGSLVKGSIPECRLGLAALGGDSSSAPLQSLALVP